jgi:hypothetical protein
MEPAEDYATSRELSITNRGLTSLPFTESNSPRLAVKLDLSNNQLETLENIEKHCERLQQLIAENNQVKNMSELYRLSLLPKLSALSLAGCPIVSTEGYRHIAINLLPRVDVIDRLPVTKEEKVASDSYCRRNFSTLPTLLQNLTNIILFKNMVNRLKVDKEAILNGTVSENNLKRIDYKTLLKEETHSMREETDIFNTRWTIDIIDDVCVLVEDLVTNHGETDFLYDRAFMKMIQMQLSKIEELRDQVDGLIRQINEFVDRQRSTGSPSSEPRARSKEAAKGRIVTSELYESHTISQTRSRSRELANSAEAIRPSELYRSNSPGFDRIEEETYQGTSQSPSPQKSQSPAPSKYSLPNSKNTMIENQRRIDDLTLACQSKDNELTNWLSRNISKKETLMKLNGRIENLSLKDAELLQLENLRKKLVEEKERLEKKLQTLEDYEAQCQSLEEENKALRREIDEIQVSIKDLLVDETNLEMAIDLRNYHLKVKFFIAAKEFIRMRRVETIADQFRTQKLKASLLREWKEAIIAERKYALFCARSKMEVPKEWQPELLQESLAENFRTKRAKNWKKFYFDVLAEYAAARIEKEGLKELAYKYYSRQLKKKALGSIKVLNGKYSLEPLTEETRLVAAIPKLEFNRKKAIFTSWKTLFVKELKPLHNQFKRVKGISEKLKMKQLFNLLKTHRQTLKENEKKLKERTVVHTAKHCLRTWITITNSINSKYKFAAKRLLYRKTRLLFKRFREAVRREVVEREKAQEEERKAKQREDRSLRAVEESSLRELDREQKLIPQAEKFRQKWSLKYLFSLLKEEWEYTCHVKKERSHFEEDDRDKAKEKAQWADWAQRNEERERQIEEQIPVFRAKNKQHRKRLVLLLLREAATLHKCIEEKADNLQARVELNTLRRSFRGLKKNLLEELTSKTKAMDKRLFLGEDYLKKSERNNISTINETEHLQTMTKQLEDTLKDRLTRLEEAKRASKQLEDSKNSLALKLELLESQIRERQAASQKKKTALEIQLDERKAKVVSLQKELDGLLQEVKTLDKQIEGSRENDFRGERRHKGEYEGL